MGTRYYELIGKEAIDAIQKNKDDERASLKIANEFAEKHGLGEPKFRMWHMFDCHLGGFKSNDKTRSDTKTFIKPDDNLLTRPRAKKSSAIYREYSEIDKKCRIDDEHIDDILGWNKMTYFPTRCGLFISYDEGVIKHVVFHMPERVNELKHCKEISNIEYFERFNKDK